MMIKSKLDKFPTCEFTQSALRKILNRDVSPPLVTDNAIHFSVKSLSYWLKRLGCRHLHAAPCHLQYNGLTENFVRTFKTAIYSVNPCSSVEILGAVDNFL